MAMRAFDLDVVGIEEHDEQARARALRHRQRFANRVRLHPGVLRSGGADDDVLELLDALRDAAFEDLEVGLGEIRDRRAILHRRRDVDADVVGLGAEGRLRRGGGRLRQDARLRGGRPRATSCAISALS